MRPHATPASIALLLCGPPPQETRRAYRENFYTADIGSYYSGVIMFKETLQQVWVAKLRGVRVAPARQTLHELTPLPPCRQHPTAR
jgi:hypothetical protein